MAAAPSWAQDACSRDIKVGRVNICPGFGFDTRFNDNIFLEANRGFVNGSFEGNTEDVIFTNRPELTLRLPRERGGLKGNRGRLAARATWLISGESQG